MQLKQRDEFILDIAEIATRYERHSPELPGRFFDALERATTLIVQHPLAWPLYKPGIRKYRLKGFPFLLFYTVVEEAVILIAITHTSRKPESLMDRLT